MKRIINNIYTIKLLKFFPTYLFANSTSLILIFVDGVISGNYLGEDAIIGIGLASPIMLICGAGVMLASMGASVLISKAIGRNDKKQEIVIAKTALHLTLALMILFALIQPLILVIIVNGLDPNSSIAMSCIYYSFGIYPANIVGTISAVGLNILVSYGESKSILKMTIVEVAINVILDLLFVCVLNMGVFGAGLGTSIANIIRALLTIYYFQKRLSIKDLFISKVKCQYLNVLKTGTPNFIFNVLPSLMMLFVNNFIFASLGEDGLLAKSLANYSLHIAYIFSRSINSSLTPILGLAKGTMDSFNERRILRNAVTLTLILSIAYVVILAFFPNILYFIFGLNEVSEITNWHFQVANISCIVATANSVFFCYLIFSDKKLFVSISSCVSETILFPLSMFLFTWICPQLLFFSFCVTELIQLGANVVVYIRISSKSTNNKLLYLYSSEQHFQKLDSSIYLDRLETILKELKFNKKFILKSQLLAEEVLFFNRFANKSKNSTLRFGFAVFDTHILYYSIDDGNKWEEQLGQNKDDYIIDNYLVAKAFLDELNYSYILDLNYFSYRLKYDIKDTLMSAEEFEHRKWKL